MSVRLTKGDPLTIWHWFCLEVAHEYELLIRAYCRESGDLTWIDLVTDGLGQDTDKLYRIRKSEEENVGGNYRPFKRLTHQDRLLMEHLAVGLLANGCGFGDVPWDRSCDAILAGSRSRTVRRIREIMLMCPDQGAFTTESYQIVQEGLRFGWRDIIHQDRLEEIDFEGVRAKLAIEMGDAEIVETYRRWDEPFRRFLVAVHGRSDE